MSETAIISGTGALPTLLARTLSARNEPFVVCQLEGYPTEVEGGAQIEFRVERLVPFLNTLVERGVRRVVFGGAARRPQLDLRAFDTATAELVPRLMGAMQDGDDATLREVIAIFEEWDLKVVGAHDVAPDLVPGAGILTGTPGEGDQRDAARAAGIVEALGSVDVGQSAVVAQGLCLAIEALPGTDAMLDFVAATQPLTLRPDPAGAKGILYKAPKPGQERRVDLPAIGPTTVRKAAAAGLGGVVWEAGGVLCIDREGMIAEAEKAGMFLWSRQA
ncbi:UDP-2,3-diacylglucosamine diphosphatase LpxI [Frigidibacter sp. MR17.14]|uniref:LpxI family protein n=1 Tax=Frigidibacter sp. MR17.14 TaxID=3126509 RepID=UPI003012DE4E